MLKQLLLFTGCSRIQFVNSPPFTNTVSQDTFGTLKLTVQYSCDFWDTMPLHRSPSTSDSTLIQGSKDFSRGDKYPKDVLRLQLRRQLLSIVTAQIFYTKVIYWIKPCESLSLLVHFILFTIRICCGTEKCQLHCTSFCTIFKSGNDYNFSFLTFEHERLFENHLSVNENILSK